MNMADKKPFMLDQVIPLDKAGELLTDQIKKIPEEIRTINSALMDLSKVSNTSLPELETHFGELARSAGNLGISVSDMINATADWSRMGYSLPDSKKLAEITALYRNISKGIDIETANQSLAVILQEFKIDASNALKIVDQINALSKNSLSDNAGIAQALQISAPSFSNTNTDPSRSLALIAGTNSVVPDAKAVGEMWNTVAAKIYGTSQELGTIGTDTNGILTSSAELRDQIKDITGFDIISDQSDTQLKDIYDIVIGIGTEWKNLSAADQNGLLESLAGSEHGNILNAALNNISAIKDAYKTAENCTGSALASQDAYEQGIQFSLDRLEASFQTFAAHILNSDLLKGIIDFGNGAVSILDTVTDKLGSMGTIGLGAGLFASLKNIGKCRISVRISKSILLLVLNMPFMPKGFMKYKLQG